MGRIFSGSFWFQIIISTIITMIMIALVKKLTVGKNIPVLSGVSEAI